MQSTEVIASVPGAKLPQSGLFGSLSTSYLLGVALRNWHWPLVGGLIGLLAALAYISSTPAQFKSSARILIDSSVNRYLQNNKVIDAPTLEENEAGSQIYILSSESIILPVVRSFGLAHDPEFVGSLAAAGAKGAAAKNPGALETLKAAVKRAIGTEPNAPKPTDEVLERIAVEEFIKRLTVEREDVPSVMSVSFASEDAEKASKIANAIADRYIATSLDVKAKSTKLATEVLRDQLTDLKRQSNDAELLLQDYMIKNNLVANAGGAGGSNRVLVLNEQLSIARAALAEAKARIEYVKQNAGNDAVLPQVGDNEVILRLRSQYLDMTSRITDFESRLGKKHAAVIKLRKSLGEVTARIDDEKSRIADGYMRDYEIAKARDEKIVADLAQEALSTGGSDGKTKATVTEMRSNAEALRDAYSAALTRYNEISKNSDAVSQDARVITRAAPPLNAVSKKHMIALGGGISLGLLLGLASLLARELASTTIRMPGQIRQITDAYCVLLPVGKVPSRLLSIRRKNRAKSMEEYVLDAQLSRFTEAFRNLRAVLIARKEHGSGTVVCVVSAVAGEGKTIVTSNLAGLMASSNDLRVLVVDARLQNASLTERWAPKAKEGLSEALKDASRLPDLVVRTERTGFHLLPYPAAGRLPNAADMFGSQQLDSLIAEARKIYDVIIIEASPIMAVADVKMIDRQVDQYVLVVEWDKTDRRLLEESLAEVEGISDRLSCVVINKVDPAKLKYIDAHKGRRFADQYRG